MKCERWRSENAGIDLNFLKNTVMDIIQRNQKQENISTFVTKRNSLKAEEEGSFKIWKQINECNLKKYPFGI